MTDPRDHDDAPPDPIRDAREEALARDVTPAPARPTGEQPGDEIGRYKLLQQIGEGGMGTVWMAEQSEPVRRKVALKIIKLGMDTKEVVARFEAERQALALMEHPNIAHVLDGGATDAGRPFFVMELVRGIPITEYCDRAKLGVAGRLQLFASVCQAIQHAHTKGVVHRDIKPSNVMVTLSDGTPMAKVIDFGIAKATSAELTQKTLFTQFSQMIGTPEYMAPEQAELSALDVDTRADVYSLGVLLYELLTGTTPFSLHDVLQRGYSELMRTIREDDPAKPSTRVSTLGREGTDVAIARGASLDRLSTSLRGDLDRIVMKAMSKDRTLRYQTAVGFADDVGRFLRNEPVEAAAPSAWYRLRKLVRRRRKTVTAVALLGVSLVLGVTGTALGWAEARTANERLSKSLTDEAEQRRLAVAEAARASRAEAAARARADDLERIAAFQERRLGAVDVPTMGARLRATMLDQVEGEAQERLGQLLDGINLSNVGLAVLQREVLGPTVTALDATFADDPDVRARLLAAVARSQYELGLYADSVEPAERALMLRREHAPDDRGAVLDMMMQTGSCLAMAGRVEDGERLLRDALDELRRDRPGSAGVHLAEATLAKVLGHDGRLAESCELLRSAHAGFVRTLGGASDQALEAMDMLQAAQRVMGRYADAEAWARDLLATMKQRFGDHHVRTYKAASALGYVLMQDGGEVEAVELTRSSMEGLRQLLGDDNVDTLAAAIGHGRALFFARRLEEAEAVFEAVRERAGRVYGESSPLIRTAMNGLGVIYGERGEYERASEVAEELARRTGDFDEKNANRAAAEMRRAQTLAQRGEVDEALAAFRLARGLAVEGLGSDHYVAIQSAGGIARMLYRKQQFEESERMRRIALRDARRVFGAEHEATLDATLGLAITLQARNQHDEALALFEQVVEVRTRRHGPDDFRTLNAKVNLATSYVNLDRVTDARELLEVVVEKLGAYVKPEHPVMLQVRLRLVEVLTVDGQFDRARPLGAEVVAGMRGLFGDKHPETGHAFDVMLMLEIRAGEHAAAIEWLRRGIARRVEIDGEAKPSSRALLGGLLLDAGQYDEAERELRAWLALPEARRNEEPWSEPLATNRLAAVMAARGAFAEAAGWMERSCRDLKGLEVPRDRLRDRDPVAAALARGVAFYEAWHEADPDGGHDERAAAVRADLEARRAGGR